MGEWAVESGSFARARTILEVRTGATLMAVAAAGFIGYAVLFLLRPALYDAALLAEHRRRGVVLEGYSPFKNTDLGHPVLAEIAARHRVTPAQVVLRWHLDHEVVVIPKSATPERIAANFDVFGFSLSDEELRRIDGMAASRRR